LIIPAKALGIYLALLWLRFKYRWKDSKIPGNNLVGEITSVYTIYFAGRTPERAPEIELARNAGVEFVDKIFELHKEAEKSSTRNKLLDQIELDYYQQFQKHYLNT